MEKTLLQRLAAVQQDLKAPKSQVNSFGKYNYRNAEDILEAVKPLLAEQGLTLTVSDDLVNIGERYYIKAVAKVYASDTTVDSFAHATGYAREEAEKKGMDGSQITGAASSYARKYALNGLFLIDDTKDSDATNTHGKAASKSAVDPDLMDKLRAALKAFNMTGETATEFVKGVIQKPKPETNDEVQRVLNALKELGEDYWHQDVQQ